MQTSWLVLFLSKIQKIVLYMIYDNQTEIQTPKKALRYTSAHKVIKSHM